VLSSLTRLLTKDKEFIKLDGKFVLSDDSHGITQVGVCYDRIPKFLQETGIESLMVLGKGLATNGSRFSGVSTREVSTNSLKGHKLFTGEKRRRANGEAVCNTPKE